MSSVYADILGEAGLAELAPECRALHDNLGTFTGEISVEMTCNPLLRLGLRLSGFPPEFDRTKLEFSKQRQGEKEVWMRHMGRKIMRTVQRQAPGGRLAERLGLMTASSRLVPVDGGLDLVDWRFHFAGVPLPRILSPKVTARERPKNGRYHFEISISPPWSKSNVVRYHGWLNSLRTDEREGSGA